MAQTARRNDSENPSAEDIAEQKRINFVEEAHRQGGEEGKRLAYCLAYGQVKLDGFGKSMSSAMKAMLLEIARKQQFKIPS